MRKNGLNSIQISIDDIPNNVVIYRYENDDFIFVEINKKALETENFLPKDLIGKKLTEVYPGVKEFGLFDLLVSVYKDGEPRELEMTFYEDERISGWRHNTIRRLSNGNLIVFYRDMGKEKEIEEELKSLGHIIDNSINEVFIFDAESFKFTYINKAVQEHMGYTLDEMRKMTPVDIKPEYTKELFLALVEPLFLNEKKSIIFETIHKCKNNELYTVEIHLELMIIENKKQFVVLANDISEHRKSQEKLQKSQEELKLLAQAIEQTDEMVRITDRNGVITYVNDALVAHTGYRAVELLGENSSVLSSSTHDKSFYENMWTTVLSGKTYRGVFVNRKKDKNIYYDEEIITPIFDENKMIQHFVITSQDITQRIEMEEELQRLATVDSLTGIYNRHKTNKEIEIEITRADRKNESFSLVMFDIDNFKGVNDTYGHDVGDYVLCELSSLVLKQIRESDRFGRWGGEEFMLLLPSATKDEAIKVAQKLRKMIERYPFPNVEKVTISFGVSIFKNHDTKESLLKRVDRALYEAKESGRNCVVFK